jgi:4-hydroxybenzoate polyprenyltransferase
MLSRKQRHMFLKLLGLFSVVRGYAIIVLVSAQVLTAVFILSPNDSIGSVLKQIDLWLLISASSLAIAAGYIINNFYDKEKDLINRPKRSMLDRQVRQQTQLTGYFLLNFCAVLLSSAVSFNAVLFFTGFIFLMWYYSHRLKKYLFIGNISAAILSVMPLFVLVVYYRNFAPIILAHAGFLLLLLVLREVIKDLENLKGDLAQNYQTIPVVYGERVAKFWATLLLALTYVPTVILLEYFPIGGMRYYFYATILMLLLFVGLLWRARDKKDYLMLHALLRLAIVVGIGSIVLLDFQKVQVIWS